MKLTASFVAAVVGAAMFFIPEMTRRRVLFGLAVPAEFRESERARRSIAKYRTAVVIAVIAVLIAIFASPAGVLNAVTVTGPILILLIGGVAFVWEHRKLAPYAVEPSQPREAAITKAPERLPWFVWLAPGPLAILGAASAYLSSHWNSIPASFPVHWGLNGEPDRFVQRTAHAAYQPVFFGLALCTLMLVLALAIWFGARRSKFRRVMLGALIGIEYMQGLLFSAVAVIPIVHLPIWVMPVIPLVFIVPMLFAMARAIAEPSGTLEPTPNECWKAGMIYYNPNDPALFVERRAGLGYTFNFGNPWSWVMLAVTALVVITPLLF